VGVKEEVPVKCIRAEGRRRGKVRLRGQEIETQGQKEKIFYRYGRACWSGREGDKEREGT
jgi:hypothetical protein